MIIMMIANAKNKFTPNAYDGGDHKGATGDEHGDDNNHDGR